MQLTSYSSTPPELPTALAWKPILSLPTKLFEYTADPWKADVVVNADCPHLPKQSSNKYDIYDDSSDSLDLDVVECKAPMSLISNDPTFRQKHLVVPDGSDGSDGTSYPLTKNYTLPVA